MCDCALPDGAHAVGSWHYLPDPDGRYRRERCPEAPSPLLARLVAAGVPEEYQQYTRSTFPGEWPETVAAWVLEPKGNVYVYGSNGTGKTHLATAILGELMVAGAAGGWCSAKLLPELNPDRNEQDREYEAWLRGVFALVVDDLFSEQTFKAERVRNLCEWRYQHARPTLYTSMKSPKDALAIDSDLASRACSGLRIYRSGVDRRFAREA